MYFDCLAGNSTIEITRLQNRSLEVTNNADLMEATQYDVYCWAEDNAVDGVGFDKRNFMTQDRAHRARSCMQKAQYIIYMNILSNSMSINPETTSCTGGNHLLNPRNYLLDETLELFAILLNSGNHLLNTRNYFPNIC